MKVDPENGTKALILLNKDTFAYKRFYCQNIQTLMQSDHIEDISPDYPMETIPLDNFEYWLRPSQVKILLSRISH